MPTTPHPRPPAPQCGLRAAALLALGLSLGGALHAAAADPYGPAREIEQQFRGGDTATALQRLDQALAAQPGDARLRFLQGVLLSESGRPADASAAFERMTEEFPDLPEPYNNLAVLQASAGQLDRARSLLETALRLDPTYLTAHENLGDVFVRLARRAYQTAAANPRAEALLKTKLRLAQELAALR